MRLHSLIFPPFVSEDKAKQLAKQISDEDWVRIRKVGTRVRIGYTLPKKDKTYVSKVLKNGVTMVFEIKKIM